MDSILAKNEESTTDSQPNQDQADECNAMPEISTPNTSRILSDDEKMDTESENDHDFEYDSGSDFDCSKDAKKFVETSKDFDPQWNKNLKRLRQGEKMI